MGSIPAPGAILKEVVTIDKHYHRDYYRRQSDEYKKRKVERQLDREVKIKRLVDEYKKSNACGCGENHPPCLEFHHIDDNKEVNISDAVRGGWSVDRIFDEIRKCIVVCANCHRKIHFPISE